jgi:RND family efflux transporter MFP subunit
MNAQGRPGKGPRKAMKMRTLGAIALLAAATLLVPSAGCGRKARSLPGIPLSRGEVKSTLMLTGRVEASKQVVITVPYDSLARRMFIRIGQKVQSGQPLVELDSKVVEEKIRNELARVSQLRSRLSGAEIKRRTAQRGLASVKPLLRSGAMAQVDVDNKASEVQLAENEVKGIRDEISTASAGIQILRQQIAESVLRAPITGVVTSTWVASDQFVPGSAVKLGDQLVTISAEGDLSVRSSVRESDVLRLFPGMSVEISLPAIQGRTWPGKVVTIDDAATVDKNTGAASFRVVMRFRARDIPIKSGMEARGLAILDTKSSVLRLPRASVDLGEREATVMAKKGERFMPVKVALGLVGDTHVEIVDGLQEGDLIAPIPLELPGMGL